MLFEVVRDVLQVGACRLEAGSVGDAVHHHERVSPRQIPSGIAVLLGRKRTDNQELADKLKKHKDGGGCGGGI